MAKMNDTIATYVVRAYFSRSFRAHYQARDMYIDNIVAHLSHTDGSEAFPILGLCLGQFEVARSSPHHK